jgi:hypothetical protein
MNLSIREWCCPETALLCMTETLMQRKTWKSIIPEVLRKLTPEEIALSGQRAIFVRYQSLNQEANLVNVIIVYILRNGHTENWI